MVYRPRTYTLRSPCVDVLAPCACHFPPRFQKNVATVASPKKRTAEKNVRRLVTKALSVFCFTKQNNLPVSWGTKDALCHEREIERKENVEIWWVNGLVLTRKQVGVTYLIISINNKSIAWWNLLINTVMSKWLRKTPFSLCNVDEISPAWCIYEIAKLRNRF